MHVVGAAGSGPAAGLTTYDLSASIKEYCHTSGGIGATKHARACFLESSAHVSAYSECHTRPRGRRMRDNALYFPYISVPERAWTVKTVLYWDKLFSIVPYQYVEAPEKLSAYMRELVHAGLVEQIFPANYVYGIANFDDQFLEILERRGFSADDWRSRSPTTLIHMEKLGDVSYRLQELGIARRESRWMRLPTEVANLFMAYLASSLGHLSEIRAVPITDKLRYGRLTSGFGQTARWSDIHMLKAREVVLNGLLPVPSQHVSVEKLARFKQDHGSLLRKFRRYIEENAARIGRESYQDARLQLTEDFVVACRERVDEIVDAMRPTWTQIHFGSLIPLAGAGMTWHGTPPDTAGAYGGAALTFAGVAYLALQGARSRPPPATEPLAYVAFAKRAFK